METPCVDICVIDKQNGLCAGCYRTVEEIARWSSMTPQERREIMDRLPARRPVPERG